jgi:hypothetical protein
VDNEDTRRDLANRTPEEPSLGPEGAFRQAMAQHQRAVSAFCVAVRDRDATSAAVAADEAFRFWLTARAVLRRRELADDTKARTVRIMRCAVDTNRRALLALFSRAERELASPELRVRLEHLRSSLALVDDETALDGGPSCKGKK